MAVEVNERAVEVTRLRVLRGVLPLLCLLSLSGAWIVASQPVIWEWERDSYYVAAVVFSLCWLAAYWLPNQGNKLSHVVLIACTGLLAIRCGLVAGGPLFLNPEKSAFDVIFAYIPLLYVGVFLLYDKSQALLISLVIWLLFTLPLCTLIWPLVSAPVPKEGVVGLFTYMLIGNPIYISLLCTYPQYEKLLQSTRENLEEKRREASTDDLTKLFNRRFFIQELDKYLKGPKPDLLSASLIALDVDKFKQYNDTYGHPAGDHCLQRVAETIRLVLRDADVPARLGGDEFCVLLGHTSEHDAKIIAHRIVTAVHGLHLSHPDKTFERVTISAGAAGLNAYVSDMGSDDLLSLVDRALYAAKAAGRNQACSLSDFS